MRAQGAPVPAVPVQMATNIPPGEVRQGGGYVGIGLAHCEQRTLQFINQLGPGCHLWAVLYGLNRPAIIQALNDARARGVFIHLIVDRSQWNAGHHAHLRQNHHFDVCVWGVDAPHNRRTVHSKWALALRPREDILRRPEIVLF